MCDSASKQDQVDSNYTMMYTVLIQIFEGRIFCGCHKFSIFAILFSRITGFCIDIDYVRTIIKYKFSRT